MTVRVTFASLFFAFAATLATMSATAAAQTAKLDHARIARQALENHIHPGYERLVAAFGKLDETASGFCSLPAPDSFKALQENFAASVQAWGAIAHINFGPIRNRNNYERIWFWPDRKSIGQRQVANALRQQPADYTDVDALADKSIAVQGLGALEQVLYGGKGLTVSGKPAFACDYARTIAANLRNIAAELEAAWRKDGTFGKLWLNPGPDNKSYLSDQEPTFALIRILAENLERVRDAELARPLGVTESRRVLSGPFNSSQLTMNFIAARIAGLRSLLVESGLVAELTKKAEAERDEPSAGYLKQALFEMDFSERRSAELAAIPNILGDETKRSEAIPLGFPLKSARTAFLNAAGRLTRLPVGYNASDGD